MKLNERMNQWIVQHAQNWVTSDLPVGTPITPGDGGTPETGDARQVSAGMIDVFNNHYM